MLHRTRTVLAAAGIATAAMIASANAAEIQCLSSTAMREGLDELVPHFEKQSGHKVVMHLYPAATLVAKVKEGAAADIVMTTPDKYCRADENETSGRRHARRFRAFTGRHCGEEPARRNRMSGTPEALKAAFLAAKSIGISRGPSGVHLLGAMAKLGIAEEVKAKMVQPDLGVRVGTLVADGKAEIGVQQVGELLPIPGIVYIGPLPAELQTVIVYGMGRSANAKQWDAASALVKFLTSPPSADAEKDGLDPA